MNPFTRFHRSPLRRRVLCRLRVGYASATTTGLTLGSRLKLGRNIVFETWRSLSGVAKIELGHDCWLEDSVRLEAWGGSIVLGQGVFVGPGVVVYGHGGVSIGDRTLVSMHCRILSSNHTIPPIGVEIFSQPDQLLRTQIGSDVWLGAGVTVLGGVRIGDGCVVGAGAVVTKDLPDGAIAYGIPAEVRAWRKGAKGADIR